MNLTVVYQTNRRNPRFQWFFDSLRREWDGSHLKIVVVDFYAGERTEPMLGLIPFVEQGVSVIHTAPMRNVWQGPHRLTTRDYFSAAVSRNTGLCFAPDGYIVYVDDLSVLLPGWFKQVRQAAEEGWVACGSYAKVRNLQVQDGLVVSFNGVQPPGTMTPDYIEQICRHSWPNGFDNRWKHSAGDDPFPCSGNWLYGASCAIPVEALLKVGGWDWRSANAGGGEDYICGLMMEKHGYKLKYCKRMMTFESEEGHGEEPPFIRVIKGPASGPNEKTNASWVLLNSVMNDPLPVVPDNFGNGGLRGLRESILSGGNFDQVPLIPEHDWYDKTPLKEM